MIVVTLTPNVELRQVTLPERETSIRNLSSGDSGRELGRVSQLGSLRRRFLMISLDSLSYSELCQVLCRNHLSNPMAKIAYSGHCCPSWASNVVHALRNHASSDPMSSFGTLSNNATRCEAHYFVFLSLLGVYRYTVTYILSGRSSRRISTVPWYEVTESRSL